MRLCTQKLAPRRRLPSWGRTHTRVRIDLIVVAPTRIPSLRSSPWIRTHPDRGHQGFCALQARTIGCAASSNLIVVESA
jgi:hypothetical protein